MKYILMVMSCLLLTGCGSIINGTTQKVAVTSTPDSAQAVAVGGERTCECVTPCTLVLKRKFSHTVTVSKDGYKPQSVGLTSTTSGAVAGNILAGGLIGWGVDAASGGDSKLVPEAISVTLEPAKQEEPQANPEKAIAPTQAQGLEAELSAIDKMKVEGKISEKEAASLRKKAIEKY